MDYGGGDHYDSRLRICNAFLRQAKVCDRRIELWPMLYTGPVCDDSAAEAAYAAVVELYK